MASQGSVFSEPVIEVTLTGDAEITIGGYMFELLGLTGKVTIDCEQQEAQQNYASSDSTTRQVLCQVFYGSRLTESMVCQLTECDLQIPADMVISPFRLVNRPIHPDPQTSSKESHSSHKTNRKRSGHATFANRLHCLDLQIFLESSTTTIRLLLRSLSQISRWMHAFPRTLFSDLFKICLGACRSSMYNLHVFAS